LRLKIRRGVHEWTLSFSYPPTCTVQASGTNLNAPDLVSGEHNIPHNIRTVSQKTYRKLLAGALEHMATREDFHSFPAEFVTIIEK
jgi:hypothetical protein